MAMTDAARQRFVTPVVTYTWHGPLLKEILVLTVV